MDDMKELKKLDQRSNDLRAEMLDIAKRRREIIIRLASGGMTYAAIGRIYGKSRERIRAMVAKGKLI